MAHYEAARTRVTWRLGGARTGARQSLTLTTEDNALTVKALVEARRHNITRDQVLAMLDTDVTPAGRTVADVCRRYVDSLTIEDSTRREYDRTLKLHIAPTVLGKLDVAIVNREHVRLWIRDLMAAGTAPKGIANHHGLLSAALNEATSDGLIPANPCRGIRLPRKDSHTEQADEMCFLSPEEVALIVEHLTEPYKPIPWILARTGLRWSELTALQVGDLELDVTPARLKVVRAWKRQAGGGLKVGPPKTQRSRRTITLDTATVDLLRALTAGRPAGAWVITTPSDGVSPMPHTTFMRAWHRVLYGVKPRVAGKKRTGGLVGTGQLAKRPRVHDLRHTHASWLLADPKVTMLKVSRRLGHEAQSTTERIYSHLRQDDDLAILGALDAVSSGQRASVDEADQAV